MQVEIQAKGFELTEALRDYVRRRLQFALGPVRRSLARVRVCLFDANGARAGGEPGCRIQVRIAGAAPVLIEDLEPELRLAIDRAADRASRTVARRLQGASRLRRAAAAGGQARRVRRSEPGWQHS